MQFLVKSLACTLVTLRNGRAVRMGLTIVIHVSCALVGTGRAEQTGLWAMLTPRASPNARIGSRLGCPEEQQEITCSFFKWGSREIDAPAHAGILASFEPEGEPLCYLFNP